MREIRRLAGLAIVFAAAGVLTISGQEWRDYAGGPDSSRFVAAKQITKANVARLEVAWTYPAGQTDFNPLVVRGIVYGLGAGGSFVALDAATGKELWVHKGVQGFTGRGINWGIINTATGLLFVTAADRKGPRLRQCQRPADLGASAWGCDVRSAIDVRAWWPAVLARDGVRIHGPRRGGALGSLPGSSPMRCRDCRGPRRVCPIPAMRVPRTRPETGPARVRP